LIYFDNFLTSSTNCLNNKITTKSGLFAVILLCSVIVSCDSIQTTDTGTSDYSISELPIIENGQNLTIQVNSGDKSFYQLNIENLSNQRYPDNGLRNGWSISWNEPLSSDKISYNGFDLYSTFGQEDWKPVNFLLNVRDKLKAENPDITHWDIQAAIWSLLEHNSFEPGKTNINQLPGDIVAGNQPKFDANRTRDIINYVKNNFQAFEFTEHSTYGVAGKLSSGNYRLLIEAKPYQIDVVNLREELGFTVAWDINNEGQIIGANSLWDPEKGLINMGNIFARAINDHGVVAGNRGNRIILWNQTEGITEKYVSEGNRLEVHDINNHGQIVGEIIHEFELFEDEEYGSFYEYEFNGFVVDANNVNVKKVNHDGWASSINDDGVVVGLDYSIPNRAYKWDEQNGLRSLGSYSGFSSGRPNGVNNSGEIVGSVLVSGNSSSNLLASARTDSKTDYKLIDRLQHLTGTRGVYDEAHVIEMLRSSSFSRESFPWGDSANSGDTRSKSQTDLNSEAVDLAWSLTHTSEAFIWDETEGMFKIGTLGGEWSTAWDINDYGQVVGYSSVAPGKSGAFIWDRKHGMIELPTLGGNSMARSINNKGQIVGYSYNDAGQFFPVMWTVTYNDF
jgi:probable HAF family extracellular repeat protein